MFTNDLVDRICMTRNIRRAAPRAALAHLHVLCARAALAQRAVWFSARAALCAQTCGSQK